MNVPKTGWRGWINSGRSWAAALGLALGTVAAAALGLNPAATAQTPNSVSPAQVREIAQKAYPYGLQQVIYSGQRWIYTQNDVQDNSAYMGVNRIYWIRKKITPDFPAISPNATTLYGSGYLDLRKEPIIIEMPEITDRYFSLQLMDQYGIFHTTVGSPFNGTKARNYLIVPPGYKGKLPGSFPTTDIVSWPSKTALVQVRMAVMSGSDEEIAKINAYQDKVTVTLLSDWTVNGGKGVPQAGRKIVKGDFKVYPRMPVIAFKQVEKQTAQDYYTILSMVLNDPSMTLIRDSLMEAKMLEQLKSIGIGPGLSFDWKKLPADHRAAMEEGFKAGFAKVRKAVKTGLIDMNGWGVLRNSGAFQVNWIDRAVMADAGWGGPDRNISHSGAYRFTDSNGKPLNGANNYTITFDANNLPPVTQFWSIPIYDLQGYFVANQIDRYTINSFMLQHGDLVVKDGKLVIYVQNRKPSDPDKAKNWLPSPPDGFRFTARFYGPYEAVVDGSYPMPAPVLEKRAK